eukprot:6207880-Prymnesium_polylepis.1
MCGPHGPGVSVVALKGGAPPHGPGVSVVKGVGPRMGQARGLWRQVWPRTIGTGVRSTDMAGLERVAQELLALQKGLKSKVLAASGGCADTCRRGVSAPRTQPSTCLSCARAPSGAPSSRSCAPPCRQLHPPRRRPPPRPVRECTQE